MTVFTRKRLVVAAIVGAFVVAFAAIGALSKTASTAADSTVAEPVPIAPYYWTMAVSPTDPDVLVLGTSNGLYRSTNGGKTWKPTGPKKVNATSIVQAGSSIFLGGVPVTPGARPWVRKGSGRAAPDGPAVLAASTDDGQTWQTLHPRGLPDATVQALAVDPAKSTTLYALLNSGRLYRSTDGARSFRLVTSKVGIPPFALAIVEGGRLVAGDMDSGSLMSTNGKAFKRTTFKDSKGGRMVMEYAVQPTDMKRVLMTAWGIEMSTDSGRTWRPVLKSDVMFGPVAWAAPTKSDLAYAVGFDRSVWRSEDSGQSWTKVT